MPADLPLVVSSGVCVGCGACAVAAPEAITVQLTERGTYLPALRNGGELSDLDPEVADRVSRVCPFSNSALDEDALGAALYSGAEASHHEAIGYHRAIVAGHVVAGDFRDRGTSGGMTSWMLHRLLSTGEVDAVVHVTSSHDGPPSPLSHYAVSRTVDELLGGRKSRYHVQTLADVMLEVRSRPGRYAVVGVPCFVKAVRLLAEADELLRERVVFTASLVCGHLKSALYSEYLAWSLGVAPADVDDIDYRHKEPGRPPNRYCVRVSVRDRADVVRGVENIPMADWGIGLFKLGACDYCDDVVGEAADVSFGDAWLPPFMSDWRGANVAIARSDLARRLLDEGAASGELDVIPWTPEQAAASQAGALRHRRPGLAVRLAHRARRGQWAPVKRVQPVSLSELDTPFAQRMLSREAIAVASPEAFLRARERGDLALFAEAMKPLISRYDGKPATTALRRALARMVVRLPPRGEALVRRLARVARVT